MRPSLYCIVPGLTLMAWVNVVQAGDPTRPPAGFQEVPSAVIEAAPVEVPLALTGVFLLAERPYAMINGQAVRVGEELGAGQVVSGIDEQGLWLKTPKGVRQIKLLPQVKKTAVSPQRMENQP